MDPINSQEGSIEKRSRRRSVLAGCVTVVGVFLLLIGILASIKITPWAVYQDTQFSFEIKYPAYWEVKKRPLNLTVVAFIAPQDNDLDAFREVFNVSHNDLRLSKERMTLTKFSKTVMQNIIEPAGDSIKILESRADELAGYPAYRFSFESAGEENPVRVVFMWTLVDNDAYTLGFSVRKSELKKYMPIGNKMLKSFKILQ